MHRVGIAQITAGKISACLHGTWSLPVGRALLPQPPSIKDFRAGKGFSVGPLWRQPSSITKREA